MLFNAFMQLALSKQFKQTRHIYHSMLTRCRSPRYKDYYGRGITVCERWRKSFKNFIEDMGLRPYSDASIERIDVNGNYEPTNCKWIPRKDQAKNKTNTIRIEHNGKIITLSDLSEEIKVTKNYIQTYRQKGLTIPEIITKYNEIPKSTYKPYQNKKQYYPRKPKAEIPVDYTNYNDPVFQIQSPETAIWVSNPTFISHKEKKFKWPTRNSAKVRATANSQSSTKKQQIKMSA